MASAVEKRLKDREEARRSALERNKLEKEGKKNEEETQEYFYSRFTKLKQDIEGNYYYNYCKASFRLNIV